MLTREQLFGNEKSISEYLIEDDNGQNKFIEELKKLSIKERQFLAFKMYYNGLDERTKNIFQSAIRKYPFILSETLIDEANEALLQKKLSIQNRNITGSEIMMKYKSLLRKISVLANELNIHNSLELCILYSYLLWNGYLSKTKQNVFKLEGRKLIIGLFFADIIDGIGVCLNHAEMLKDILNECGYKSVILENYYYDNTKVNYMIDIGEICITDIPSPSSKKIFRVKKSNHTFNLIEENNKLYIYDSTNLLLYNIIDSNYSKPINGKGKNKLFPYPSYGFCMTEDDITLLDKLFVEKSFPAPYTKEDLISTSEVNLEIIKNSTSLLEDFYTEARIDMIGISEETDKIISKQRRR